MGQFLAGLLGLLLLGVGHPTPAGPPPGPIGAPTVIAEASAPNSSAASLTLTVATTIPAGTLVFVPQCVTTAIAIGAVTDSKGNAWTAIAPTAGPIVIGGAWSILTVPLVAGDTIQAPFANVNGRKFAAAYAVSGVAGFDQVGAGTSGEIAAGLGITTGALAQANEIVFFVTFGQAMNSGSWTEDANSQTLSQILVSGEARRLVVSHRLAGATTPLVYSPTLSADQTWAQNYVAFKGG